MMNEATEREWIADIETAVRDTPGVTAIYHTGGLVSKMVAAGAQLLGAEQGMPRVRLEQRSEGSQVR